MFFVTVLHTFGHGGILQNSTGIKYDFVYLFEIIAYCAVNCYAIISGFVMYSNEEKTYRYSKYITMWLQVFFYSFGITLVTFIIKGSEAVSLKELIRYSLPVITKRYWYFSAYTGVFFFVPLLNKLARTLSKRQFTGAIILLFVIFGCVGRLKDPFYFNNGYSAAWLVVLYLFGAWIKKFDIASKIKNRYALIVFIASVLITWLFKIFSPVLNNLFISYMSPTIILNAICLVIIFSKLHIGSTAQRIIKFLSPAAFGVYIIHEHGIVKTSFIVDKFIWICEFNWLIIPIIALGCAMGIFVVCISIEKIRLTLFKCLRINQIAESVCYKVEVFLTKHVNKILDHID